MAAASVMGPERERVERAATPAKRKLDSRDLPLNELEKQGVRPPPFEQQAEPRQNGHPIVKTGSAEISSATTSATMAPKPRRTRHTVPPIWATVYRPGRNDERLRAQNFILHKPAHNVGQSINGKLGGQPKAESAGTRHSSPDDKRSIAPFQPPVGPPAPGIPMPPPPPVSMIPNADGPLGPWEQCITNTKPINEIANVVADFLFINVVDNPEAGEIGACNIQYEVEAKLGVIINKETNDRVDMPVITECVLADTGRWAFRSTMTLAQHKAYNEYLNSCVADAHQAKGTRVPIAYKHRRETDKFYDLPDEMRRQLPACIQNHIPSRHSVKVRVTYDQKTNKVLAAIIKARIADLHIHFPRYPMDCRISVNLEMPWEGNLQELERKSAGKEQQPDRGKDRLSYTQTVYQIDLTQVKTMVPGPNKTQREEIESELEIELNAHALIQQGRAAAREEPHQYPELVEGLIDNVRNLTRTARLFNP